MARFRFPGHGGSHFRQADAALGLQASGHVLDPAFPLLSQRIFSLAGKARGFNLGEHDELVGKMGQGAF